MKEIEALDNFSGRGSVYKEDGTLLGDADYDITIFQTVHVFRDERKPGLKNIEGWVEPIGSVGKPLTLHLEDGRRLDFFFSNSKGAIADLRGRGFYEPD